MHVSRSDAGSNAAFQRAVHALQTMCCEDIGTPPSTPIRETIIGVAPATRYTQESNSDMPKIPYNFNASQREAVLLAMVNDMTLVKGPPGTGKTKHSCAAFSPVLRPAISQTNPIKKKRAATRMSTYKCMLFGSLVKHMRDIRRHPKASGRLLRSITEVYVRHQGTVFGGQHPRMALSNRYDWCLKPN